jgi:polyhydroxyalkanoate synthesis repressor PhaR
MAVVTIKKYANRRLYDTAHSRYITMDELADIVRRGTDVRVVDVESDDDLTQVTLTQIIIEGRGAGKLLPVPLLLTLIRMGDDALAEFLSGYMTVALEAYLQLKRGAQNVSPYVPFATAPFSATNAFARMLMGGFGGLGMPGFGGGGWGDTGGPTPSPAPPPVAMPTPPPPPPPPVAATHDEVAAMRRELEALKRSMGAPAAPRKKKSKELLLRRNMAP